MSPGAKPPPEADGPVKGKLLGISRLFMLLLCSPCFRFVLETPSG